MNTRNILGGVLGGLEEDDYEKETSIASIVRQSVEEVFEVITGAEFKSETKVTERFSSGSIDFKNNQAKVEQFQKEQAEQLKKKTKIDRRKVFFQSLKEDMERAQKAKDKLLFEEEINDIVTNLPTEQKNRLLHYQASYKDRSIYQRAELRRKLIEQQKQAEDKQKEASIPSPAKQPSAIEGAFEGRSGSQGSGSANLSAQAVG